MAVAYIAYAVAVDLKIDVKSVSETRRAAKVNWLMTRRGVLVLNSATDEDIEALFDKHKYIGGYAQVMRVDIRIKDDAELEDDPDDDAGIGVRVL